MEAVNLFNWELWIANIHCGFFPQGMDILKVTITLKSKHSRKQNTVSFTFLLFFQMSSSPSFIPGKSHKTDFFFQTAPLSLIPPS